jgi:hypothetical protein
LREFQWPLWVLGLGFFVVIGVRIALQSITIDEGDTYVYWVSGKFYPLWQPNANNHLLNTYLIWLFTHIFGLNNFSMRLPSLIGAMFYFGATYHFCLAFVDRLWLRIPLMACLLLNPFVMDFFVAARGYGLALGFLTAAIVCMCQMLVRHSRPAKLAVASTYLALCFVSNFSFAIVCVSALIAFIALSVAKELRCPPTERARSYLQNLAALFLPGMCIVLTLAGWTLFHWPKGQITTSAGASSVLDSWNTFLQFTFSSLNQPFLPPYVLKTLRHWRKALPWLLIGLTTVQLAYLVARYKLWRDRWNVKQNALVAGHLGTVLMLTAVLHLLAFYSVGLLLPKDRTSIFFLPLCLMFVGAVAGVPWDSVGRVLQCLTAVLLLVGSAYFAGCLRLRYFFQWRFDADMQQTYQELVRVVGSGHEAKVPCWFLYTSALNYYREYFHDDSFASFGLWDAPDRAAGTHYRPYPSDSRVYVLKFPDDEPFTAKEHLTVVYRGPISDAVIAVRKLKSVENWRTLVSSSFKPDFSKSPRTVLPDGHN